MKPGLALRSVFTSNAISFRENRVCKQQVLVYLNKAETYNIPQVNMEVISWLGAYFVKNELYEKAMAFFERAAQVRKGVRRSSVLKNPLSHTKLDLNLRHACSIWSLVHAVLAAQIQPQEVKWKLMVASCHRRIQNFSKALQVTVTTNHG
jgi:hypothetical protein